MTFALLLANFGMGLLSLGFSAMNLAQGSAWLALANLVAFTASFACCIFMAKVEGDSYGRYRSSSTPAHSHPSYSSGGTVVGARGTLSIALNPRGAFVPISSFDDTLERPIENAGIRAGEIRALRAWRVRGDCLFSVYMEDFEWSAYSPSRGDVDCSWLQGIFAFKERDDLDQYLERKLVQDSIEMIHFFSRSDTREADLIIPARDPSYVIGTVDLWGTVIEHERGYRAEFASVATLDDVIGKVDLEALRRRYRVRGSS